MASSPVAKPLRPTFIRPTRGWVGLGLTEVWEYRELLFFLLWRDVKLRYRQTAFGAAWAILQPFLLMVVFTLFLGKLGRISSGDIPYAILVYAALVPWTLFSQALASASDSLVGGSSLVSKVYFPRLILPTAAALSHLVDFVFSSFVLGLMMVYYGIEPSITVLLLPGFLVLALVTALGVGLWLAAVNVRYRDVKYAVPFLIQLWMFGSPVAYPATLVPDAWQGVYSLNPLVGVTEGFRWALLGAAPPVPWALGVSAAVSVAIFVTGMVYFRRVERTFADIV